MTNLIKKKKFRRQAAWPPRVFKCELEKHLKEIEGYSINNVAAYLEVNPITMKSIIAGGTVSLQNALRLAELVGKDIKEIWTLRK